MFLDHPEKTLAIGTGALIFGAALIVTGIYALSVLLPVG